MFLFFISSIKANKQSVNCEWLLWCPLPPPYIIKIDIFLLSKFSVRSTLFNLFAFPFPTVYYTSVIQYLNVGFTSALISSFKSSCPTLKALLVSCNSFILVRFLVVRSHSVILISSQAFLISFVASVELCNDVH